MAGKHRRPDVSARSPTYRCRMGPEALARGAWVPLEAAAELLDLDVAKIRRGIESGTIEVRVLADLEVVRFQDVRAVSLAAPEPPTVDDPDVT
jgi:hypothetical protein